MCTGRDSEYPDHEWHPAVVRRHKLDTCAEDYNARIEAIPTTIGVAPFHLHGLHGTLKTFNKTAGTWMISLDNTADDILIEVHERFVVVKPLSRIPSDQSTAAWLHASDGLTSGEDLVTELLWYLGSYTPAYTVSRHYEKACFFHRIL